MRRFSTSGLGGQKIWNWTVAPSQAGMVVLQNRIKQMEDELEKRFGARPAPNMLNKKMRAAIGNKYPRLKNSEFVLRDIRNWAHVFGECPEDLRLFYEYSQLRQERFNLYRVLEGKVLLDAVTMSPVRAGTERREIEGEGNRSGL